jgi:hypothetical protein
MTQATKSEQNIKRLRSGLIAAFVLLITQFIVGMYLNFYVELPDSHPGTNGSYAPSVQWALAGHAGVALAIHVAVWILLTFGAISALIRGIMSKRKDLIVSTALGLLFILMAGSGGLTFLNRGGNDQESFTMALGFLFALFAYGFTFYRIKER